MNYSCFHRQSLLEYSIANHYWMKYPIVYHYLVEYFIPENVCLHFLEFVNHLCWILKTTFNADLADLAHTIQWSRVVSNHQQLDYFFSSSFRLTTKKMSTHWITGSLWGNSSLPDEFPPQRVSNGESVSISWRQHVKGWMLGYRYACIWPAAWWCPVIGWHMVEYTRSQCLTVLWDIVYIRTVHVCAKNLT